MCCKLVLVVLQAKFGCALLRAVRGAAETYKTSVVFSVPEGSGQLFKALSVFALRDLDMTKIESRPMRSNPVRLANSAGVWRGRVPSILQH